MGITFSTKSYTCNACGHKDKVVAAIKDIREIETYFTTDSRPKTLDKSKVYIERIARDEFGFITLRDVVEHVCDKCQSNNITAEHFQEYENVLNFYPPCESEKWFNGFQKHIG